jgi:hypothetical protein
VDLPDLAQLRKTSESSGLTFLQTDLDLAFTLAQIADVELQHPTDPKGAESALQKAERAYSTVERFLPRVADLEQRSAIALKLTSLRAILDALHKRSTPTR